MPANTAHGYPYPLPTEPVAEGAQAIRNLAEAVEAKNAQTAWVPLTLPAYSFAIPGFAPPRAHKQGAIVTVQGLLNTTAAISAGLVLATLPAGHRPGDRLRFATQLAVTGGTGPQLGVITVEPTGEIKLESVSQTGGTTVAAVSLAITFSALGATSLEKEEAAPDVELFTETER